MPKVAVTNLEGIWYCVGAVLEVQEISDGDGVLQLVDLLD
jgi:hypothetical protein